MSDVTRILSAIDQGDPTASERLLPLVYNELRKLAAGRVAQERPGQTLQATALVHEAYLRLIGDSDDQRWDSRGHFFAAAAEAMRQILVDVARSKAALKRGGLLERIELTEIAESGASETFDLLALDEALGELERQHPEKAQIIKLRFFAGLTLDEAAQAAGVSRATAERRWSYARAWLFGRLNGA
jgi:RNA polymerase sigma factor (TIGR02999 family)